MSGRLVVLLAVLTAFVAFAVGCGGDDDDGASASGGAPEVTTSSLTQEEFVKEANAICRNERKNILEEIQAYFSEPGAENQSPQESSAGMLREIVVPTIKAEIEKVSALGAPAGDEKELEEIFAEQTEIVDEVAEVESIDNLEEYEDYFVPVDRKIWAYGFRDCTNSPDPTLEEG